MHKEDYISFLAVITEDRCQNYAVSKFKDVRVIPKPHKMIEQL